MVAILEADPNRRTTMRYGMIVLFLALGSCDSTSPDLGANGLYDLVAMEGAHPIFDTPVVMESGKMMLGQGLYTYEITHRVEDAPAHTYRISGTFEEHGNGTDRWIVFSEDEQRARVSGDRLVQDWRKSIRLTWQRIH